MKDRLEEFVRQHREGFDVHEPDPALWDRIRPAEEPEVKSRTLTWLRYAAAVAVIFAGFSAGIFYLTGTGDRSKAQYSEIYLELMETETYYNQLVNEKYNELKPYLSNEPGIREDLKNDFRELDQIFEELKADLQDDVANPEVVEAMIRNYRIKVEILEDLLYQIKEKEHEYENNEEKVTL